MDYLETVGLQLFFMDYLETVGLQLLMDYLETVGLQRNTDYLESWTIPGEGRASAHHEVGLGHLMEYLVKVATGFVRPLANRGEWWDEERQAPQSREGVHVCRGRTEASWSCWWETERWGWHVESHHHCATHTGSTIGRWRWTHVRGLVGATASFDWRSCGHHIDLVQAKCCTRFR